MRVISNESGAVLVLALMVVTVLAIYSLTAIITSTQGLHMGSEYRSYQNTVYIADGGADYATGLIMRTFANGYSVLSSDSNSQYVNFCMPSMVCSPKSAAGPSDGSALSRFQSKINGVLINTTDSAATSPNIILTYPTVDFSKDSATETAGIVVEYVKNKIQAGSSSEFAARYEGIGSGSAGGVGLYYRIDAYNKNTGQGAQSTVRATFKCIEGGGRCL
jgi:hypothetical protein